jgi:prepilin-type processing-associated H-X9-DG protein
MPRDDDTSPCDVKNPISRSDVVKDAFTPVGPHGMMSYFCIDRHKNAINVVFLDGHAVRVPLADFWKLKWNASFTPKDVIVGQ